jgi:hypothetical protein
MLHSFMKKPLQINLNNNLREYCVKTTNDSIKKLTEKHNLERKIQKNATLLLDDDDSNNFAKFNFLHLLLFLSISSATLYFYKRLK